MAYIPNPADATQPTDNVDASTAAAEFRTLKGYIQALVLAAGMFSTVRQTVNDGFVNATGDPAFMIAAAAGGEALDLKATGRPLVVNFAGGSTGTGVNDRNSTVTGDTANIVTALPASNTSYIYADYVNAASMTFGSTLAPVQYGKIYDSSKQALLQFSGAAGSTTFLDDNGNTWTAQGGAKVQTNQFKFGTGGLGGAGAANVLNGAADYIKSTAFTSMGAGGSWSMRGWFYVTVLPGVGSNLVMASMLNAATVGALFGINNVGGTIRFMHALSSDGATNNIANFVVGTALPVINTWYFIEETFDALGGAYSLYVNGVREIATVSTAKLCATTAASFGASSGGTSFMTGYIDKPEILPYAQHVLGTVYAVPTAAPSITATGYACDQFDIQAMKMYSVTGPSVAAGTAPVTTQKYRCYLGEVDAGAAVPTTITNYAFNGRATTPLVAVAVGVSGQGFNHNLGLVPTIYYVQFVNQITDSGYTPGMSINFGIGDNATQVQTLASNGRKQIAYTQNGPPFISNLTTGARVVMTAASWKMQSVSSRGWGGA